MSLKDHENDNENPERSFAGKDPIYLEEEGADDTASPDPAGFLPASPDLLASGSGVKTGPGEVGVSEGEPLSVAVEHADEALADRQSLEAKTTADGKSKREGKPLTRGQLVARRFFRSKTAVIGLVGFTLIVLFALLGPLVSPWDYRQVDSGAFLQGPSAKHWFGTGQTGRDLFAMTVQGLRKSLIIGLSVAAIQTFVAAIIGASAAYFGKTVDKVLLWFIDLLLVIPSFLLIAIITQKLGSGSASTGMLIVLLAGFGWMLTSRVVRSMTLSVINLDYVRAARYMSVPSRSIIGKHIIPNVSSYLIIDFTLGVVSAVMAETVLSYFGFGVQPPDTSLGVLLSEGQRMATSFPWTFLAPASVLVIMLISVNFMGDALRDAIDPSSKAGGQL